MSTMMTLMTLVSGMPADNFESKNVVKMDSMHVGDSSHDDMSGVNAMADRTNMDACMFDYCATRTYGDFELFSSAGFICARGCALAPEMATSDDVAVRTQQCEDACAHSNCMITPYTRYFRARTGYHDARRVMLADAVEVCKRGCRRYYDPTYSAHLQHDPQTMSLIREVPRSGQWPTSVSDLLPYNKTELAKAEAEKAAMMARAEADVPKSTMKKPKH
jgi:hypothetical protein